MPQYNMKKLDEAVLSDDENNMLGLMEELSGMKNKKPVDILAGILESYNGTLQSKMSIQKMNESIQLTTASGQRIKIKVE